MDVNVTIAVSDKLVYNKQLLLSLYVSNGGKTGCPTELATHFPQHLIKDRVPLGLASSNGGKETPKYGGRGGGRTPNNRSGKGSNHAEELLQPHPDEAVIFSQEHLNDEEHFR
jgi:hypothetical protein